MLHPGLERAAFSRDGSFIVTAGATGKVRVWEGDSAQLLSDGFELNGRVQSFVTGPDPRRVTFVVANLAVPLVWDVPVENRPLELLAALSVALSGHVIDAGEGLSPATPQQILAAPRRLCAPSPITSRPEN